MGRGGVACCNMGMGDGASLQGACCVAGEMEVEMEEGLLGAAGDDAGRALGRACRQQHLMIYSPSLANARQQTRAKSFSDDLTGGLSGHVDRILYVCSAGISMSMATTVWNAC